MPAIQIFAIEQGCKTSRYPALRSGIQNRDAQYNGGDQPKIHFFLFGQFIH
jgi:hypothetical protein